MTWQATVGQRPDSASQDDVVMMAPYSPRVRQEQEPVGCEPSRLLTPQSRARNGTI
jgi:hypothetical protein